MEPEAQLIAKLNEVDLEEATESSVERMKWRDMAILLVKLDFAKVREQFVHDDVLDSVSGPIFKLFLSQGPSPPLISVKSSTTLILLLCRLIAQQPQRLILPLADFATELLDMGANSLKSDDEGNSCLGVMYAFLKSKHGSKPPSTLLWRTVMKLTGRIAANCPEGGELRSSFESYVAECDNGDYESDELEFDDLAFFMQKVHCYPAAMRQTLYCVYFYGKIDINAKRNELDDDVIAHLARQGQLDRPALQVAQHYEFDFGKRYGVDRQTLVDFVLANKTKNKQQQKNLVNLVLSIMKEQSAKTGNSDAYEASSKSIENIKQAKENVEREKKEKEKEKEFAALEKKVKQLESDNSQLTMRLKTVESQVGELWMLLKGTPPNNALVPKRRSYGKH